VDGGQAAEDRNDQDDNAQANDQATGHIFTNADCILGGGDQKVNSEGDQRQTEHLWKSMRVRLAYIIYHQVGYSRKTRS